MNRPTAESSQPQTQESEPDILAIFRGYTTRPPWQVAGVDYATGYLAGVNLRPPTAISNPGVSVDTATHIIRIASNNVVLDGLDFGLSGGWGIYIPAGVTGTIIRNSYFHVGSTDLIPIQASAGSGSLTVERNSIDGGGGLSPAVAGLIIYNGNGTFIARYNSLMNAPADGIDFSAGTMTVNVSHNIFYNLGTNPESHPDPVQFVGVHAPRVTITLNTIIEPNPGGMEGIQLCAQGGSTLLHNVIARNVLVARGPAIEMSYSIAIQQMPGGNVIDGAQISQNYIDLRGAYGAFYPPTGTNVTFAGNVNMVTGAMLAAPRVNGSQATGNH